ncbi:MAG: hypothetical protein CML98_08130 [Rhodobiaceae bacterium]|nr:hypothetical protein [Rhodobiaceae bacterium]|tara:strand:- start:8907 stop:9737 length:831 start_codon:yes stop_codon:yes gene_type:complete
MKIFYGDNQFLGVNHSKGKGASYLSKYDSTNKIAITLTEAWDAGIRDFCFTVNSRTVEAINIIKDDCPFNLHPALPYAHDINELISEKGLAGALISKTKEAGLMNSLIAGFKALFGRYDHLIKIIIDVELKGIPKENIKSIGLLNVANDFLLGLRRDDLIKSFYSVVNIDFKKTPFFYTMNFPKMADMLWGNGFNNCSIIFNYNEIGFRTNPSKEEIEKYIKKYSNYESIAMSVFSGSNYQNSADFLIDVHDLSGVLFGSSKKENIINNYEYFTRL